MDTYFTFPDGALRYDCHRCGELCCRGKGFALGAGELVPLLGKAPGLAAHLRLRPGGSFAAVDVTDACWFLAGDGNCRIEVEHGRAFKPSTCRLFPFNRIYRAGDVRIVDVNSQLCPVETSSDGSGGVRHAELTREIDEIVAGGGGPLVDVPAQLPAALEADWLTTERAVSDAARAHAGDPAALARATGDGDADGLAVAWARVYGLPDDERRRLEALVAPRVALILPSLRWNALRARGFAPGRRAHLPRRARALTFLVALAARWPTGVPSLRAITELWEQQSSTLDVLTRWAHPVKLAAPRFDADLPPQLQPALGALLAGAFRGGQTLGALVELAARTLPAEQRPLTVALAASQLETLFGDQEAG